MTDVAKAVNLVGRRDLFTAPGGDTVQMEQTARWLQEIGTYVPRIVVSPVGHKACGVMHLFNITRVHDVYARAAAIGESDVRVLLSPIHHRLEDVDAFERHHRTGLFGQLGRSMSRDTREMAKALARALRRPSQLSDAARMLGTPYSQMQQQVLGWAADGVIVNSAQELACFRDELGYDGRAWVSHCGLSDAFLAQAASAAGAAQANGSAGVPYPYVLCVGRIEPRKNQLALVSAARAAGVGVVLIGTLNPVSTGYGRAVLKAITEYEHGLHVAHVPQTELPGWYARAEAHVSVSWFETVGLVSLEALACGTRVIATARSYTRDYTGDAAWYWDPHEGECTDLLCEVLSSNRPSQQSVEAARSFTWESGVREMVRAYDAILG
jgi:hypothetical protein